MTLIDGADGPTPAVGPGPAPAEVVTTPLVARLREYLERDGGFTVVLPSGRPVSGGVSVCADPDLTLRFPTTEWDTSRVARWLRQLENRIVAEALHIGGWLDPRTDHVVLDVVAVFPDDQRARALAQGRHHAQRAAFDLTNDELIPLPGSPRGTRQEGRRAR